MDLWAQVATAAISAIVSGVVSAAVVVARFSGKIALFDRDVSALIGLVKTVGDLQTRVTTNTAAISTLTRDLRDLDQSMTRHHENRYIHSERRDHGND